MGAKVSSGNNTSSSCSMVRVITADGSLQEFSPPILASDALSNTPNSSSFFICDSDSLYFDCEISDVLLDEFLRPGHLYFILPISMLGNALSHLEMAAMAVKATSAFASTSSKRRVGGRKIRVMPVLFQDNRNANDAASSIDEKYNQRLNEDTLATTRSSKGKAGKRGRPLSHRLVKKRLTAIEEVADE